MFQLLDNHQFQLIEKDEAKEILRNNQDQQIVWDMEISFVAKDLETIGVIDQKQYAQFFAQHFPKLLAKENLDVSNLNLFFTIHSNTANPHYHIVFSEKKPKFVNQNNQKVFKSKGKFDPHNLKNFRHYLNLQLEGEKAIEYLYESKKTIWDNRKAVIKNIDYNLVRNDQEFLDNIQFIKKQMANVKNKTYARANDEVRNAVETIKQLLLTKDSNLMAKHNELIESFNLISDKDQRQLMQDKELADLNQRFGNEIIKYALDFDQKQLLIKNPNFSHLKHLKNRYNLSKNSLWKQIIFDLTKLPYQLYELKKAFIVGKTKIEKIQKQETGWKR